MAELVALANLLVKAGIACVVAAIVGGGLKFVGIEIPVLKSQRRQIALGVLGVGLAATGFYIIRKTICEDARRIIKQLPRATESSQDGVLVLVRETVDGYPRSQSTISARLESALVSKGYKVIGVFDPGPLTPQCLDALRISIRKRCNWIVYGSVEVPRGETNQVGFWHCRSQGSISVYHLRTSGILASMVLPEMRGRGHSPTSFEDCAERGLRDAADYFAQYLVPKMQASDSLGVP